MLVST